MFRGLQCVMTRILHSSLYRHRHDNVHAVHGCPQLTHFAQENVNKLKFHKKGLRYFDCLSEMAKMFHSLQGVWKWFDEWCHQVGCGGVEWNGVGWGGVGSLGWGGGVMEGMEGEKHSIHPKCPGNLTIKILGSQDMGRHFSCYPCNLSNSPLLLFQGLPSLQHPFWSVANCGLLSWRVEFILLILGWCVHFLSFMSSLWEHSQILVGVGSDERWGAWGGHYQNKVILQMNHFSPVDSDTAFIRIFSPIPSSMPS